MGFFGKLFGRSDAPPAPALDEAPEPPADAFIVLRQGMNVPSPSYVDQVLALAFPEGPPGDGARFGLAQPVWFKNSETADSAAGDVAAAFAKRLGLDESRHSYRTLEGPEGSRVMVVELRRGG